MSSDEKPSAAATAALTLVALIAFAANSVLCRLALGGGAIDAAGFTAVRLASGGLVLAVVLALRPRRGEARTRGGWAGAAFLFAYAAAFSFAYITLDTGTGALVLFGAVQITMILASLLAGAKLHPSEWIGVLLACGGFVYLVLPGVSAPPLGGFLLMAAAGAAWGAYTLKGRGSFDPLGDTAFNFARTVPLAAVLAAAALVFGAIHVSLTGLLLAAVSGGLTSGLGYSVWYTALRGLSATQAAVVQLAVPLIAASGGVLFVGEAPGMRLVLATALILGGILTVILGRACYRKSA